MILQILYAVMPFAFIWFMHKRDVAYRKQLADLVELAIIARSDKPQETAIAIAELRVEEKPDPEEKPETISPVRGVVLDNGDELSFLTQPSEDLLRDVPRGKIRYVDHT